MVFFLLLIVFLRAISANLNIQSRETADFGHQWDGYAVQKPPLDTPWTYGLGSDPWTEYPRPQMQRTDWISLNGIWQYRNASSCNETGPYGQGESRQVLIPSCLESAISGIQGANNIHSIFSRNFTVPSRWRSRAILLNFGAVDYQATVYVSVMVTGWLID